MAARPMAPVVSNPVRRSFEFLIPDTFLIGRRAVYGVGLVGLR